MCAGRRCVFLPTLLQARSRLPPLICPSFAAQQLLSSKPLIMVLLKSPFDGKKSQLDIAGPGIMSKSAGPSAYPTKASNQVENVLEARGLGLQLFSKGLLEKNRVGQDLPHLLATRSASDTQSWHGPVLRDQTIPFLFSHGGAATTQHRCCRKREFGYKLQVLF